jgi:VanZ family protein
MSRADRLLAGWTALVAVLLLVPTDFIREVAGLDDVDTLGLDKAGHFLIFLVTAALAAGRAEGRTRHPLLVAGVATFLYGAALELLQGLSGVRYPELGDLIADGLGSLAGVFVPALRRRRR